VLALLEVSESSSAEIARKLGKSGVTGALKRTLRRLLADDLVGQTIPDKPQSRLQKYRLTAKGLATLRLKP
jgi:ATP-dependent DNA helicase RecG